MKLREELPEFSRNLEWINGKVRKEHLERDIPILVHFWSVSCFLCKDPMSLLTKWSDLYQKELIIIGVHMPRTKEDTDNRLIQTAISQMKIAHPICMDHQLEMTEKFQNRIVPAYYVFDKNKLLRHYQSGDQGMWMLEKRLIRMMNEVKK